MAFWTGGDHARISRSSKTLPTKLHKPKFRKALIMPAPLQIGLLVFPKLTQLDLTGPLQVFSSVPGAQVHLIWKRIEPVPSDSVLVLTPTTTFADCPQLDVICVPGGVGADDMIDDAEMLDFLRKQAKSAQYITSVCTGSLVLGAAGLLRGYRAATHWTAMDFLSAFGATPTKTRVCIDRNRITGGGVTAGIDFCADAGLDTGRPRHRGGHSIAARIQSGAAVQCRLARHRADGIARAHHGEKCAGASPPRRGDPSRRRADGVAKCFKTSRAQKKAAWFPRRPFLSHGSSTLTGDFRTSAPGAYLPAAFRSAAAAYRDSRELEPEPTRWSPISVRWFIEP